MLRRKNLILSALAAIYIAASVTACGGDNAATQTPVEKMTALEASGAIPKLDRSDTIEGIDANANGVRDDVEAFIVANYSSSTQRAAAMQYAKGMQAALLVDVANINAVKEVKRKLTHALHCVYSRFDGSADTKQPAAVNAELRAVTTNTKQRLFAYLAYSKALDGASWAMPEGNSCE